MSQPAAVLADVWKWPRSKSVCDLCARWAAHAAAVGYRMRKHVHTLAQTWSSSGAMSDSTLVLFSKTMPACPSPASQPARRCTEQLVECAAIIRHLIGMERNAS